MNLSSIELAPETLDVSLVIPVRDEADNVPILGAEISTALDAVPWRWECVWVDDGSEDATLSELERLHARDPRHRFLALERATGQSAALAVGFGHARGGLFIMLDGDGQSDPAEIPGMVRLLRDERADMVNGWRRTRRDSVVRKVSSRIGNGVRNRITHEQVRDVGCSLRVIRRDAVHGLPVFHGMHRFLPTLVRMNGYPRILEIPVHHRPREHGVTKYGVRNRAWVGLMDTLAVAWMQRRAVAPVVRYSSVDPALSDSPAGASPISRVTRDQSTGPNAPQPEPIR